MALIMTGLGAVGIYKFLTNSKSRADFFGEITSNPIGLPLVLLWCACILLTFWGVFVPALGGIIVPIFGRKMELWSVAGILSLAGFVFSIIYDSFKRR